MKHHGESLLYCHVQSKDTAAFLSAHLTSDLFVGDESAQFDYITGHVDKYGTLPSLETYGTYFDVGLPPPEPMW